MTYAKKIGGIVLFARRNRKEFRSGLNFWDEGAWLADFHQRGSNLRRRLARRHGEACGFSLRGWLTNGQGQSLVRSMVARGFNQPRIAAVSRRRKNVFTAFVDRCTHASNVCLHDRCRTSAGDCGQ